MDLNTSLALRDIRPILRSAFMLLTAMTASVVLAQTASDGCSFGAGSQYTVNSSCIYQDFDKPGSFGTDLSPSTCSGDNNDDAFGWFTATSTTTTVTFNPDNNHDALVHIYSGTCAILTYETCVNSGGDGVTESITFTTAVNTNYLVRIQRNGTNNGMDGQLCIWSPPPPPPPPGNDDPCGATALTVGASCTSVSATNVSATTTAGPPAPGCAAFTSGDVWFSFTAPAGGSINIETAPGTLTDGGVAIYSGGSCTGPFTLISCNDNGGPGNMGQAQASGLTAGTTYYARVWGNGGATGTFDICAHALLNDNPCGATALTVGTSCASVAATNVNATTTTGPPAPGCAAFTSGDVWFSFVANTVGSIAIETSAGTLTDGGAAVYSATSCNGPFTLLACDDNNGPGNMSLALYNGLTPGLTYYVRVWGNGGATGTFNICAYALPNDNPCGATSLSVTAACTPLNTTNASATTTTGPPAPGCASFSSGDVWFTFVAPATGTIDLVTTAGGLTDAGMALYSATACNGTFTLIECDDNDGAGNMPMILRTGLTPGQTYYVRVWGNGGATGTFSICAYDDTVLNDEPCGAIAVTPGTTCSFASYTNTGTTVTASIPTPGCGTVSGGDVWFTFTAPPSGFVSITLQAGTLTNANMALYAAATCSSGMTLVECDDNDGIGTMPFLALSDLVGGTTYFLRVWGAGGTFGTFDLCLTAPPTASDCFYALNLHDEIGDGWGGSTVGISINGGPYTNHTLANGEEGVVYIPITIGQLVMVQYTAAGGAQNEISYTLQLGAGALYTAGPTPPTGLVFTGMADCNPPPAPSSDCRGGASICDAQTFNASPSNTGLVADLSVQTRGCLASNERQGLWYNFTPSSGGTVAFTIAPNNSADDYDFAVWGPFATVDCINKGAPLRCSYSGFSGNTGLQVGAGDNSEGSGGNKWVNALTVNAGEVYILYISNFSLSGLAFDLTWQLTNGASLDCFVLPVELLAFEATQLHTSVDLEWSTATELNNDRFVVERGTSTTDFRPIGEVDGAGNSITRIDYAFTDHAPLAGTSYYRLRQVDLDGAISFSPVRSVTYGNTTGAFVPYPNPARDQISATVTVLSDGPARLRVLDARGLCVVDQAIHLVHGEQRINAPLHGLAAGSYVLQLVGAIDSGSSSARFIVE